MKTSETNPGWDPWSLTFRKDMGMRRPLRTTQQLYEPALEGNQTVGYGPAGWYKYTRGGNLGWDVPRGPVREKIKTEASGRMTMDRTPESELDTTQGEW